MTLAESVADLIDKRMVDNQPQPGIYPSLLARIAQRGVKADDGSKHQKVTSSPDPRGPASHWLDMVRAECRRVELEVRTELGWATIHRGWSDRNTVAILRAMPGNVDVLTKRIGGCPRGGERHGLGCQPYGYLPHIVEFVVDRWVVKGQEVLDETERWSRVPVDPGQPAKSQCPICGNVSLLWQPRTRRMKCAVAECGQAWNAQDMEYLASTGHVDERTAS